MLSLNCTGGLDCRLVGGPWGKRSPSSGDEIYYVMMIQRIRIASNMEDVMLSNSNIALMCDCL